MAAWLARVRVVLSSAVTWITVVSAVVVIVAEEVARVLPGSAEGVGRWASTVVAVLGAAVSIIRRVSPVLPAERGVLPAGGVPGGAD